MKENFGPSYSITKRSVNLWPWCISKNVAPVTMLVIPFWLFLPEISAVRTEELHLNSHYYR